MQKSYSDIVTKILHIIQEKKLREHEIRQKQLEACQVGKFLYQYPEIEFIDIHEQPDFILKHKELIIGLEHVNYVDPIEKEKEGYMQGIFDKLAEEFKLIDNFPKILLNCFFHDDFDAGKYKKEVIKEVSKDVINEYISKGRIIPNPIIESIIMCPKHTEISFSINYGAYIQKWISEENITECIKKKENLLPKYDLMKLDETWLLIVIGSLGKSSYEFRSPPSYNIETKYDKVFVLEDFNDKIYLLK